MFNRIEVPAIYPYVQCIRPFRPQTVAMPVNMPLPVAHRRPRK